MTDGVVVDLQELIGLRRYVQTSRHKPVGKALRTGAHLSRVRGRGMDFSEVRNYQAGDEVRHMEWRVTARTGRPHVKVFEEERERPVVILVDFNPSMIFGTQIALKSVVAARLAALLAWTTVKLGDRVGGFLFSATQHNEFNPRGRDAGVLPLLASLSQYTNQTTAQRLEKPRMLSDALQRVHHVVKPGSILVLISDFYSLDADCDKHLNRLRAHNDILAYHICDPIELNAPLPQQYAITDGQKEAILDTRVGTVREAYDTYCQQRIMRLKEQCSRLQIQYIQTTAHNQLPQLVQNTFPGGARG